MSVLENKKDDDELYVPFQNLDKGTVLQEKRMFNDTPLKPRKCCLLLTKALYLLAQGEHFTKTEATDFFFAVTRLFESKDVGLRRMVYLVLKELLPLAEDVIIVISCLTKDMNNPNDIYRANAIRVLCKINDVAMLGQAERYLKQAIVDKEAYVSSAALVSGMHLINQSSAGLDIVKRWFSEIQNAVKSKSVMVQYHALGLLQQLRRHDRLAVSKLVSEMTRSPVRSQYAHCLLIRFTCQVLRDEEDNNERSKYYDYLESCLHDKSELVIYEAARGICDLNLSPKEITPAIQVLQLFLSSPKSTLRFAAIRSLNKVAMIHPIAVTSCNRDMENLITDSNRSIATLAITTLLKTGAESSVDHLMKQIVNFMGEISDEFKIVVVEAIKALCLKYKVKYRSLMGFLSNMLRDEGGYEYKKAIVDTLLTIIEQIPESKEAGLGHLCEFIEDCEFTHLCTKILHLLGKEGPFVASSPSKYIRYIYNRINLENANVRASAVCALAKFGYHLPAVRNSIIVLLRRSLFDQDDEVRDRATFYLKVLEGLEEGNENMGNGLLVDELAIPLDNLEESLTQYIERPTEEPFDITTVSLEVHEKPVTKDTKGKGGIGITSISTGVSAAISGSLTAEYEQNLLQIDELKDLGLGRLFKSSKPVELTELSTEYVVSCVKHIFDQFVVFQFTCVNTLQDRILETVHVKMDGLSAAGFKPVASVPSPQLKFDEPGHAYACVQYAEGSHPVGSFGMILKFKVNEIDVGDDEGYDDEYPLEDLEMTIADYVKRTGIVNKFDDEWEALGGDFEVVERLSLTSMKTLEEAVKEIVSFLGLSPVEGSDKVKSKKRHILYLSGTFVGGTPILSRIRMRKDDAQGVIMELVVRSTDQKVSTIIASAF